jgi:hypothetical protein
VAEGHLVEVDLVDAPLELSSGEGGDEFMDGQEVHQVGCVYSIVNAEHRMRAGLSPALHAAVFDIVDDETSTVK